MPMVENCRTEIRKGTAYQSWDWDKSTKQGSEFENLELNQKGSWDKSVKQGAGFENLELKQGGPWNTGLQGGDSKWQQEVWNCQTKVENFAEFEIGKVGELDWLWIKVYYRNSLTLSESLIFKHKTFLRDFIKISENLRLNLNLSYNDSSVLGESHWLYGKLNQSDLISLTDSLKYIIIKYNFNEGFFELRETLNLNLITSSFDSVKLSDALLVDIYSGYGTLGYGESRYGD